MTEETTTKAPSKSEEMETEYNKIKEMNDKLQEELLRKQKLRAEIQLAGETGGHVEAPTKSPEELKQDAAAEFFKGTSLEKAIKPDEKN